VNEESGNHFCKRTRGWKGQYDRLWLFDVLLGTSFCNGVVAIGSRHMEIVSLLR
jgi:hypothetical protein